MNMPDNPYYQQLRLLVQILPAVMAEKCFALKGGTAINLFYRDLPRYSVDIDLRVQYCSKGTSRSKKTPFLMALLIGATETLQDLPTALVAILAIAGLQLGGALFSQKSTAAALVDGGFVVAMGVVMIAALAVF